MSADMSRQTRVSKTTKAGLKLSVARCQQRLKAGRYARHIQTGAAVFVAGVLEYLVSELLELSGNAARDNKKTRILPRHLKLAIKNDEEIDRMIGRAIFAESGVLPFIHKALLPQASKTKRKRSSIGSNTTSTSGGSGSAKGKRSRLLSVEIVTRPTRSVASKSIRFSQGERYYDAEEEDESHPV